MKNNSTTHFLLKAIFILLVELFITTIIIISFYLLEKFVFFGIVNNVRNVSDMFYIIFILSNIIILAGFIIKLYIDKILKDKEREVFKETDLKTNEIEKEISNKMMGLDDKLIQNYTKTNVSFNETNDKIVEVNKEIINFNNKFNTHISELNSHLEKLNTQIQNLHTSISDSNNKNSVSFLDINTKISDIERKMDGQILELNNKVSETNKRLGMQLLDINHQISEIDNKNKLLTPAKVAGSKD